MLNKLKILIRILLQASALILFVSTTLLAKDDLATELKKSLISPCCWSGTVYDLDHNPEMEQQISKFIAQGKTKDEILEFYVGLYGERILAVPVAAGFNVMAWVAPIGAGILSIGFLVLYLKTTTKKDETIHLESDDIPFDDEIEKELKALDK